jgi:hypothetical protein
VDGIAKFGPLSRPSVVHLLVACLLPAERASSKSAKARPDVLQVCDRETWLVTSIPRSAIGLSQDFDPVPELSDGPISLATPTTWHRVDNARYTEGSSAFQERPPNNRNAEIEQK